MKALTLWQPWATLIAEGVKTIETRSWAPPKSLIHQRIAIHAAKREMRPFDEWNAAILEALRKCPPALDSYDGCPRGAVLATARLVCAHEIAYQHGAIVQMHPGLHPGNALECRHYCQWAWGCPVDPFGDFTPGRWLWFLEDIEKLPEPIPAKGRQGLWEWKR